MIFVPRFVIEDDDPGLLRQFSGFMEAVVTHARIDYCRRQQYRNYESALDNAPPGLLIYEDPFPKSTDDFTFEDDKITEALSKVNLIRKRILALTFIEGLSAQETADILGCSVDYVYLQKHRTLKALRDQIMDGGGKHGN